MYLNAAIMGVGASLVNSVGRFELSGSNLTIRYGKGLRRGIGKMPILVPRSFGRWVRFSQRGSDGRMGMRMQMRLGIEGPDINRWV
jgi:hypothetical protein